MVSILACTFCGVIESLVSVQMQVQNPTCVLLNKVGLNAVSASCVAPTAVEVAGEAAKDKVVLEVNVPDVEAVVGGYKVVGDVGIFAVVVVSCEDKVVVEVDVPDVAEVISEGNVMVVVGEDKNFVVVGSGKVAVVVCLFTVVKVLCVEVVDDDTAKVVEVGVVTSQPMMSKRRQMRELKLVGNSRTKRATIGLGR